MQRQRMRVECAGEGILPHRVVEIAAEFYAPARVTVDTGAHMLPVLSLWPAQEPRGLLISNGLSTMVFDDGELSLIKVKQMARGYSTDALGIGGVDWAGLAQALGATGCRAANEEELRTRLRETADVPGPVLIAARVNARAYEETIRVLRG
jgi:acetolactate synthase I/II/III large subunit